MCSTFPHYVTIETRDLVLDFIGRLITVSVAAFPFIWYHLLSAPFAGDKLFAAIVAVICTAILLFGLYLSAKCVHRLLSFYHSAVNGKFGGLLKLTLFIFYMLVPVLELRFLLKSRDKEVYVPAFLQPAVNDADAMFVSIHCFLCGVPELNSALLADAIRKQQRYFAGADDSFDPVVIATPIGDMLALLKTDRIYLYSVFSPSSSYTPAAATGWRIERSADGTDSAWVYEHIYDLFDDNEKSVAVALTNAIDTLIKELQPCYTQGGYNE